MPIEQLKRLFARLGEFALPGAVVDYDHQCFVAWNEAFLDRTGFSAEEIRVLEPRTIILLGSDTEGSAPKETDDANHKRFAVAIRVRNKTSPIPGYLATAKGRLSYLTLPKIAATGSIEFEQGRLVGQEEERARIAQAFHDEVSSEVLAAIFKIELAKEKLDSSESPQAEAISELSELVSDTIEKIADILEKRKQEPDVIHPES
jgi:signal transduction histidine kinase